MPYTTVALLKAYLGASANGDDTLLDKLVLAATARINTTCKRVFESAADTSRRFDVPEDGDLQLLFDEDLCQITSITNGDGTVVSPSQYVTLPRNIAPYYGVQLKQSSGIVWTSTTTPEQAITVVGRWAYSLSAPDDIQQAALRLAAWFNRQRTSFEGGSNQMLDSGLVVIPGGLPKDVHDLLVAYRRVNV